MKFKESFIDNSLVEIKKIPIDPEAMVLPIKKQIYFNLLPSHPFQYVSHKVLKDYLNKELIDGLKSFLKAEKITFILNKRLKNEYNGVFPDTGSVIFTEPDYPFLPGKLHIDIASAQMYTIYDFIKFACYVNNEQPEEHFISITDIETSTKKVVMCKTPCKLEAVLKKGGFEYSEENIYTDHPFKGKIITNEEDITSKRLMEILIFPKNKTKKAPLLKKIIQKFFPDSFSNYYDSNTTRMGTSCQKCLHCVTICPAKLNPFLLYAMAEKDSLKDAVFLNVYSCMECGLCSHVCPSKIPLCRFISKLKMECNL